MKNVLITGAGGMVGRELVRQISQEEEFCVYAVSSKYRAFMQTREWLYEVPGDYVETCMQNAAIDYLIHLAFPRNVKPSQWANGISYASAILKFAKQYDIPRIIHVSSQSVYGLQRQTRATEQDEPVLSSPYTTGKYCMELLNNILFSDRPHTNIRLSTTVSEASEERIPNKLLRRVTKGEDLCIEGGMQRFSFLDVRDAAGGICQMLKTDSAKWAQEYNLGTEENHSLLEIAEEALAVGQAFGFTNSKMVVKEADIVMNNCIDPTAFMEDCGWAPRYTLRQSMVQIIEKIMQEQHG